jgi:hypothetical protein
MSSHFPFRVAVVSEVRFTSNISNLKIILQCVRSFYSYLYPSYFFMGGCDLGWKIRLVFFRLIRISRTVAEWSFLIFAISIRGYGGNWLCCRVRHTHPQWRISNVNANVIKRHYCYRFLEQVSIW